MQQGSVDEIYAPLLRPLLVEGQIRVKHQKAPVRDIP